MAHLSLSAKKDQKFTEHSLDFFLQDLECSVTCNVKSFLEILQDKVMEEHYEPQIGGKNTPRIVGRGSLWESCDTKTKPKLAPAR